MSIFRQAFLADFFQCIHRREKNNWDYLRFDASHPRASTFLLDNAVGWMDAIIRNMARYEQAFELLADDYSRALMVKLLEYDVLDHHHVKLPLNTPEFWRRYETIDQEYMVKREALPYNKASVNLYRMPDMGLEFYGNALTVLTQFILKQYYYLRGPVVQPESGDVCIDGGSCRGEVSLNFAHSVGKEGFVYGFEFVPANLAVFEANLALNPGLAERIEIVPRALWDTSDETLTFSDSGPSSTVNPGNPDTAAPTTRTLAIDDFVEQKGLDRVDFIKMDIEGAEPRALLGAKRTIQGCKPKLAICVYHRKDDFYQIPAIINEIDPEYAFYLDHYTIHREETVLYALHKRALQKTVGR